MMLLQSRICSRVRRRAIPRNVEVRRRSNQKVSSRRSWDSSKERKKGKEKRSSLDRTVPEQPLPEGENKVVEG